MVIFKLGEEMRHDVINMSRALTLDRAKYESPTGIEALTTELRRTRGELGHIQGSRVSNVEIVMYVIHKE